LPHRFYALIDFFNRPVIFDSGFFIIKTLWRYFLYRNVGNEKFCFFTPLFPFNPYAISLHN